MVTVVITMVMIFGEVVITMVKFFYEHVYGCYELNFAPFLPRQTQIHQKRKRVTIKLQIARKITLTSKSSTWNFCLI